ncbi:AI-2E family transporter [Paenirhodobacter enshiensis]|uniref:AI-2E family transporter n=1 Tax=Paenirhodobacter enshiensis TaxID=1105367 RepID=UPI0009E02AF3|nr:AI-2E family transporter [Paenirhodobacter enshiensis]
MATTDETPAPLSPADGAADEHAFRRPLLSDVSAARWLLLGILLASVYFFHGFLVPVVAAGVVALASWPIRQWLATRFQLNRTVLAALLILVIVTFLVVPISVALGYAFRELQSWIGWIFLVNASGAPTPQWLANLPQVGDWVDERWSHYIGRPGAIGELVQLVSGSNIGAIYRGVLTAGALAFHLALTLLFTLVTLFVFYRDGIKICEQIDRVGQRILPTRWERLSRVVPTTISSTVTGMTLIAIGEGMVLGCAYWLAGAPSPVTLGVITGFMALVPGGAPLSFTLVSAFLAANGEGLHAAFLFSWGTMELFIVDKTIRPILVGGPVKMPFLPTLFGLVGGVKTLGIVGLFVGPVLMALLVTIWREWQREITGEEPRRRLTRAARKRTAQEKKAQP